MVNIVSPGETNYVLRDFIPFWMSPEWCMSPLTKRCDLKSGFGSTVGLDLKYDSKESPLKFRQLQ